MKGNGEEVSSTLLRLLASEEAILICFIPRVKALLWYVIDSNRECKNGTTNCIYQNMTRAMAVHHGPQGIRVNCVCPGMVYTPMMYSPGMSDEAREARKSRSILKTEGTGWDVGAAVRFLAGDEARWMTAVSKSTNELRASGLMPAERHLPLIYLCGVRNVC